ncbi:MAG: hypothetical protein AAGE38_15940 [Pseudomonadota bacterium]
MSFLAFILRAYALSPFVFLRYLPALAIYIILYAGVVLSTDNIWVIGMLAFLLSTFGVAFLVVAGIRGALMSARLTTAPTAEGYVHVVPRLLFMHLLTQFILAIVLGALAYFALMGLVLSPEAGDVIAALRTVQGAAGVETAAGRDELEAAALYLEGNADLVSSTFMAFNWALYVIFGICVGIFGVPMAALSANAVQYSPGNDMIYGITRYFPHQFVLYLLATALPVMLVTSFFQADTMAALTSGGTDLATTSGLLIAFGLYMLYAPCISFAGMAIGYEKVRDELTRSREAERKPEIDYEAEREHLRMLRQGRKSEASGATLYDPVAEARSRRRT